MSHTKHTPGPWWVTDVGVRNSGGYICLSVKVQRWTDQDERFAHETAEREADVRLIAAAPDLLDALKALRSVFFDRRNATEEFERMGELYYREFGRLRPGKDDPLADSNEPENVAQYEAWSRERSYAALDAAIAAIAKAEGEQS